MPVVWSMHSFVSFLLSNLHLCAMSIRVRFLEGYADDAAAIFYYCLRVSERTKRSPSLLRAPLF